MILKRIFETPVNSNPF